MTAWTAIILDSEGVQIYGPVTLDTNPRFGVKIAIAPRLNLRSFDSASGVSVLGVQVVWCEYEQTRGDGVAVLRRRDDFRARTTTRTTP